VRVSSLKSNVILKPGQQARIALAASSDRQAKEITVVNDADIQQAVAWKTGYFKFIDASIQDVMRQLSRWYDLDVVYEGKISGDRFDGKIARNAMASQILSVLEKNQVHFRIEGKKLIVLP
jgi:ferric-dicitrate binding protein FerR (iron transport regulator)